MSKPSAIAIHEAGHAVAAFMLGARVTQVRLRGKGVPGRTRMPADWLGECRYDFRTPPCPFVRGVISSAGHHAEVLWAKRDIRHLPAEDWDQVQKLNFSMYAANWIAFVTEKLLRENKNMVMDVAAILDAKGALGPRGFMVLMRKYVTSRRGRVLAMRLRDRPQAKLRRER